MPDLMNNIQKWRIIIHARQISNLVLTHVNDKFETAAGGDLSGAKSESGKKPPPDFDSFFYPGPTVTVLGL